MQRLGSWSQFLKIFNYLKTCPTRFPAAECLTPPWTPSGVLKVNSSSTGFNLCRGRWQMPLLILFSHWQMLLANALGKCQFVVDLPQKSLSQFGVTAPACTQEILFTGSKLVLGESVWDKGYEFSLSIRRAWWEIKSWMKWLRSCTVGISLSSTVLPMSAKVISIMNFQNPEVIKKARNSAICTYVFGPREY